MNQHAPDMQEPTLAQRLAQRERPQRPHVMYQKWRHLLFLHWRWDANDIRRRLPAGLHVDTFNGDAWVGIVPFFMKGVRPRGVPPLPGLSRFPELNLRTYVHASNGTPGVWFFSLDAANAAAVWGARTFFSLPYHTARMRCRVAHESEVDYRSLRLGQNLECRYRYAPANGDLSTAVPGTLDFFLTERYVLFARKGDKLLRGQIHHMPYQITPATVSSHDVNLFTLDGLKPPDKPFEHALYSPGVDVKVYAIQPI